MVFPWHDKSPYPWSSVKTNTTFGLEAEDLSEEFDADLA
jgi:hypothetical protein